MPKNSFKALVTYNPNAGKKRQLFFSHTSVTLEDVKILLKQYQIPAVFMATKYAGHATALAKEASKKGYKLIIAAGGDGTVGEIANGLIKTRATLGILPLGSYMNIAKMLSIPLDLEKAVQILKINRVRKIDVGKIVSMHQDKHSLHSIPKKTNSDRKVYPYFIESTGFGLEAQLHYSLLNLENGDLGAILQIIKTLFEYYGHQTKVYLDDREIKTRATLIVVSNGPYTGANLAVAPNAKLNDHHLTITVIKMTKWELAHYFFKLFFGKKLEPKRKILIFQAKKVKIVTKIPRLLHADGRIFGTTPTEITILPNALNVITGFTPVGEISSLTKRTNLGV